MSTTLTEFTFETNLLEDLTFDIPCEYTKHEKYGSGPAKWIALLLPVAPCGCPTPGTIYLCDGCVHRRQMARFVTCPNCSKMFEWSDAIIRIEPIKVRPHRPSDG